MLGAQQYPMLPAGWVLSAKHIIYIILRMFLGKELQNQGDAAERRKQPFDRLSYPGRTQATVGMNPHVVSLRT